MVLHRLNIFLKINNIIIVNQSRFRRARQTKDNLLYIIQNAQEGFNKDEKAFTVFFDVAAAFDKVWHNGIIYKLYELGVPFYIVVIIANFLNDRTFTVRVDGNDSSVLLIGCGVPQGGVLSPTMFSIYINKLPTITTEKGICLLFADDLVYQLRYKYKQNGRVDPNAKKEAMNTAQNYLESLEKYMNDWRLTMAPKNVGK
jgi:hypothetical protein